MKQKGREEVHYKSMEKRLYNYKYLDRKIKNIDYQIKNIEDLEDSVETIYREKANGKRKPEKKYTKEELVELLKRDRETNIKEKELLEQNLPYLTELEKKVVKEYYFSLDKKTWNQVADKFYISEVWAKQIRRKAVLKLANLLY